MYLYVCVYIYTYIYIFIMILYWILFVQGPRAGCFHDIRSSTTHGSGLRV